MNSIKENGTDEKVLADQANGHHYSLKQVAAIATAYALATTPINIMPIMVGAIIAGFAIGEATAGALATVELLTMSVTAFLLAPWAPKLVGRRLIFIAVGMAVAAHSLTIFTNTPMNYLPTRVLAGAAAGLLLLGLNTRIASSHDPVRLYGISTVVGAIIGMILLMTLPALINQFGYQALFAALALLGLLVLPIQHFFPQSAPETQTKSSTANKLPFMIIVLMIIPIFIVQLTQAGFYAFVERMATGHQLTPEAIGGLLSIAYVAAMLGSVLATWLGERLGQLLPISIGLLGHCLAIVVACYSDNLNYFYAAVVLQAFAYFFSIPYQLGLAAHLDSSGRMASIAAAIFFFGMSCGPIMGGWLVETSGYEAIAISAIIGVTVGIVFYAHLIKSMSLNTIRPNNSSEQIQCSQN